MIQGRQDLWFHVVYTKFWPCHQNVAGEIKTHQTRQHFSSLLLLDFTKPVQSKALASCFSWQKWHPVVFCYQDALLHTFGHNKWLIKLLLPSARTGLAILLWHCHQQGIFKQRTAAHWIFSFFTPLLKRRMISCVNFKCMPKSFDLLPCDWLIR